MILERLIKVQHFKPLSQEVASIFIDGLLHVVKHPKDMITARTNPEPKAREKTTKEKSQETINKIKEMLKELNPFD